MMKKIFAVLLAVMMIVSSFFGCSKQGNATKISDYSVENADYTMSVDASNEIHDISDLLYGIFFEDINFSCEGGLYAELVANRSFEFTELAKDDELYAWSSVNAELNVVKNAEDRLNENNVNFLVIKGDKDTGVENRGYLYGIAVNKNAGYKFSTYAKAVDGYSGGLTVNIIAGDKVVASANIDAISNDWAKYDIELVSSADAYEDVRLQVLLDNAGSVALDMVSLFPVDTYKNRDNGLRKDLAVLLEELTPKFLRFPGGCVIEGYDAASAYNWKDSVGVGRDGKPLEFNGKFGDIAARKQGINVWTDINATDDEYPSFMSYGLGFFEYFQFAEDIGAVGVPVINCGMYCQARGGKSVPLDSKEFKSYVQDMLDLVEFCRGDESTTWGKVRADLGHNEPFELKYICVGNENWGKDYYARYQKFLDAFNKAKVENPELYDGVELIYSSGTDDATSGGEDHIGAFEYASNNLPIPNDASSFAGAVDQHYYNDPEWFLRNADYYDENNYHRDAATMAKAPYGGGINVFLGEYASWSNTMNSALSEAAYMTGLERNGDIVRMATYAPLFSSTIARHWAPNLIWFDNHSSIGSSSYYIQKLFGNNAGTKLVESKLDGANLSSRDTAGKVGVGTWNTSAYFDNARVVTHDDVFSQDDFEDAKTISNWEKVADGDFKIENGALYQKSLDEVTTDLGSVMYYGDANWTNYTFTVEATKVSGAEGFIIPFAVENSDNCYFWNIGGYGNTVSCLQRVNHGIKSGQLEGITKDFVVEENKTYQLKVEVFGNNFKCYIDDELYVDYDAATPALADAYQVVSKDENGDIIIKIVNVTDADKTFAIDINNIGDRQHMRIEQVSGDTFKDENILGQEPKCVIDNIPPSEAKDKFNITLPKCSATVIRLEA